MPDFQIIITDSDTKTRSTVATVKAQSRLEAIQFFCEQHSHDPAGLGGLVDMDDIINHSIASILSGWSPTSDADGMATRGSLFHCIKS